MTHITKRACGKLNRRRGARFLRSWCSAASESVPASCLPGPRAHAQSNRARRRATALNSSSADMSWRAIIAAPPCQPLARVGWASGGGR